MLLNYFNIIKIRENPHSADPLILDLARFSLEAKVFYRHIPNAVQHRADRSSSEVTATQIGFKPMFFFQ